MPVTVSFHFWNRVRSVLLRPHSSVHGLPERMRAELLSALLLSLVIVLSAVIIYLAMFPHMALPGASSVPLGSVIAPLVINIFVYALSRTQWSRFAICAMLISGLVGITSSILQAENTRAVMVTAMWPSFYVLACSLLLPLRAAMLWALAFGAVFVFLLIFLPTEMRSALMGGLFFFVAVAVLALTGTLMRERMEALLSQERVKVAQASKISALGEMAGGMAHELNTPLASILLLASDLTPPPRVDASEHQHTVERIGREIEGLVLRMAGIIRGLRMFSGEDDTDVSIRRPVVDLVGSAVRLCGRRFEVGQPSLRVDPIPVEWEVSGRMGALSQVLFNLLVNAHEAASRRPHGWVRVSVVQVGTDLKILIMDSGPGVAHGHRDKIFQPFFTTKPVGEGAGLGLSASLGIMQTHGGDLVMEEHGPWTTFVMRLPIAVDERRVA